MMAPEDIEFVKEAMGEVQDSIQNMFDLEELEAMMTFFTTVGGLLEKRIAELKGNGPC